MVRILLITGILALMSPAPHLWASDSPQEARHELMEGVKDAAKPVGGMLKGEQEFDAAVAMQSFETWSHAAGHFGDLFPKAVKPDTTPRPERRSGPIARGLTSNLRPSQMLLTLPLKPSRRISKR